MRLVGGGGAGRAEAALSRVRMMPGLPSLAARAGLSAHGAWLLGWGLATVGFLLAAQLIISHGIQGAGGLGGIDAIAYWLAAGRAWRGESLYPGPTFIGEFTAYQYPPPFAQLLAPLSLLPMTAFVWLWRLVELLALRFTTGSWKRTGLALLLWPPIIAELDAGNIHLVMAAAIALAMRGTAVFVGPLFFLKFATWPLGPIALRDDARGTIVGGALAMAIVAGSFLLDPTAWQAYGALLSTARPPDGWYNVLATIPIWLRFIVAAALGLGAVRFTRLAPIAVTLAYPVVWFHALSTLVAVAAPVPERATDSGLAR